MTKKPYTKTFNNYIPKKTNNLPYNIPQDIESHFYPYIQKAPEKTKFFCIRLIENLPFAMLDLTITRSSKLMSRSNGIIFNNATEFYSFIVKMFSTGTPEYCNYFNSLSFDSDYFETLYGEYCSYISKSQKKWVFFSGYINDIYKYYPPQHFLYQAFLEYNNFFLCVDQNLLFKDNRQSTYDMFTLDQTLNNQKIKLFNKIPQLLSSNNFYTSAPCCTSNYSFNFNFNGEFYHAYYADSKIKYERTRNSYAPLTFCISLKECKNLQLSDVAIHLLYNISGGYKKGLDMFAILCAIISTNYYKNSVYVLPSKNCSPLQLYTVFSSKSQLDFLIAIICALYFSEGDTEAYELKKLMTNETLGKLLHLNLTGAYPAIPVIPSSSKESEVQIAKAKKIIQRKPLSFKCFRGQTYTLLNHLPIVCFTDVQGELNYLNTIYRTKVFHFKHIIPNMEGLTRIPIKDAKMLIFFLSIYGLHLLYSQNWHISTTNTQIEKNSCNFLQQFLNDCISFETGAITYANQLYDAYSSYCKFAQLGTPLTPIVFTKEIRKICLCEYKKPRHSRTDNCYAFIGMKKDEEKVLRFVKRLDNERPKAFPADFCNVLTEPLEIVHSTIQSLLDMLEP